MATMTAKIDLPEKDITKCGKATDSNGKSQQWSFRVEPKGYLNNASSHCGKNFNERVEQPG